MKKLVFAGLLLLIGSGLVFAETFYTISRNDYRSLMIEIAAVETDIEFARILTKEDEAYFRGKLKAYRYIVEKIEKYETNDFYKQDLNPPLSTPLSIDERISLINGRNEDGSGLVFAETYYRMNWKAYYELCAEIAALKTDIELIEDDNDIWKKRKISKLLGLETFIRKLEKYDTESSFSKDVREFNGELSVDEKLSFINGRMDLIEMKLSNPNETKKRLDKLQEGL